jgi:predicted O-methyltransferase YrrM
MSPAQGRAIYDHVIATKPDQVLELGTAHGVSACYLAAALQENGRGHVTTLDRVGSGYDPPPEQLLERCELSHLVTRVQREDSSYDWYLKERIDERSDTEGNCEPLFDLCYLDGAHEFTIDGLAVVLVEKLLRDDGWLLIDDLTWTFASQSSQMMPNLSDAERREPHMQAIFDLIIKQNPNFTEFRVQPDLDWAWAHKQVGQQRRLSIENSQSLAATLTMRMRETVRRRRERA